METMTPIHRSRATRSGAKLLLVGLCFCLLFSLGFASPASAAGQAKEEAKMLVSLALKSQKEMTRATSANRGMRSRLAERGRCLNRVIGSITPEIYTETIRRDTFLVWQYSLFDTLRVIYEGTRPTSVRTGASFRRAATGVLAPENKVLRAGLVGKAREVTLGGRFPASNPCAVARTWQKSGYAGARELIDQAVGWRAFSRTRDTYNESDDRIIKASSLIAKVESYEQGLRFLDQSNIRGLQAWDFVSFPSAFSSFSG